MSIGNTRPGVWITFRCHRCNHLRLILNAEHYCSFDSAHERAAESGWTTAPLDGVEDGAVICPPCSKKALS